MVVSFHMLGGCLVVENEEDGELVHIYSQSAWVEVKFMEREKLKDLLREKDAEEEK